MGIVVQLIGLDASCFSSLVFNTKLHQAGVERLPQPVGVAGQQGTEQTAQHGRSETRTHAE